MKSRAKKEWDIQLRRTHVIHVPCYADKVIECVGHFCGTAFRQLCVPPAPQQWMIHTLHIVCTPTPSVAQTIKACGHSAVPRWTASLLESANQESQIAIWRFNPSFGLWVLDKGLEPNLLQATGATVTAWIQQSRCACNALMRKFHVLQNATGHLVVRKPEQWAALLPPTMAHSLSGNAKNRLLPDYDHVASCTDRYMSRLLDLSVPFFIEQEGRFEPFTLASPDRVSVLQSDVTAISWEHIQAEIAAKPHLSIDLLRTAVKLMKSQGSRLGQWDKALHRVSGVCRSIDDLHVAESVLFGSRFSMWG